MEKTKDIVLITPSKTEWLGFKGYHPHYSEAMGLSYLAGTLLREGYKPHILDMEVHNLSKVGLLAEMRKVENPLVAGIAALNKTTIDEVLFLSSLIRREFPNTHITLGGHLATFSHRELLRENSSIDSIVRGEGEFTMSELTRALISGEDLRSIRGLSYRFGNKVHENPRREVIGDLDSIAFPFRYNLEDIRDSGQSVSMSTSRGCQGGCTFCTLAFFTKKWRARSGKNVVDEIAELYERGVRRISFEDENFLGHCSDGLERALEFCDEMEKKRFPEPISYKIMTRVDDLDENLLLRMKSVGLDNIFVGVESFNQRQLDLFNKRITPEQIGNFIGMLKKVGVSAYFSFIMFDPYATLDEVSNNVERMSRIPEFTDYRRLFSVVKPDVGTKITRDFEKNGLLEPDGNFAYKIRFVRPETELLWKVLQAHQARHSTIDQKLARVKDERIDVGLYKSRNESLVDSSRKDNYDGLIAGAERCFFEGWVDIVRYGINLARNYQRFEDVRDLFPDRLDEKFGQASLLLDRARVGFYLK
jgi:radical SAM superfamily enzyme YgiQ (UPF0313 family)